MCYVTRENPTGPGSAPSVPLPATRMTDGLQGGGNTEDIPASRAGTLCVQKVAHGISRPWGPRSWAPVLTGPPEAVQPWASSFTSLSLFALL